MKAVWQAPLPFLLAPLLLAAPESYPCQNGLVRSLVAREPMFINPVAVAVDNDGSIYVTETTRRKVADLDIREVTWWIPEDLSHTSIADKQDFFRKNITSERFKKHPSLKDHNRDGSIDWKDLKVHSEKIHKLVDSDGDGMADKATLFADGFNTEVTGIAAGVLARNGDVYATIAPDVWKLRDTDGDGKADERKVIASGFGVHINYAGHDMHGLTFGPDGKLYWTIGDKGTNVTSGGKQWIYPHEGALLRCNPDGSDFEVFARGLRNVQEIAFDDYGNIFGVDNDSDQPGEKERLIYITEGSDHGWRCYYQYRGGKYNPWMAERIAFPEGPDRPAAITPPLALYLDGPSGFAYNPGTALSERYRGHFFLTQFPAGKINAFKLEPSGASFTMTGDHLMASGAAFTGCNFGPDGALYVADWQGGYPLKEKGAVWKIDDPKAASGELRKETARLLKEGAAAADDEALIARLAHADQRVRLDAQWELASRQKWELLKKLASSDDAAQLARIHALWGLSQGGQFDPALFASLGSNKDAELRAQAAKWAGETIGNDPLPESFGTLLGDSSARVRFQAAMAVGKAGDRRQVPAVIGMIAADEGKDAYLLHAAAFAFRRIGVVAADQALRHPAPAVRLAAVIGMRDWIQDHVTTDPNAFRTPLPIPSLFEFLEERLSDSNPAVVAEAARALYDDLQELPTPLSLAELLETKPDGRESALRRSIAANRRLGDHDALLRLAYFAENDGVTTPLRIAALESLASAKSSDELDPVNGRYAPLKPLEISEDLSVALSEIITPLARDPALSKAAEAALDVVVDLRDPATLLRQIRNSSLAPTARLNAIRHLKQAKHPEWLAIASSLLKEDAPLLRSGAAVLLADEKPSEALAYIRGVALKSADLAERQSAIRLLPLLPDTKADLDSLVAELSAGRLEPGIQLEVIESASALQPDSIHEAQANLAKQGPLAKWTYALAGGNTDAGKKVFNENLSANCTACHRIGVEGSNVGPPLTQVGKQGAEHILESLVAPQAKIATGFGTMTLTKTDGSMLAGSLIEEDDKQILLFQADGSEVQVPLSAIASRTPSISTMPPMGDILKPAELRDLVAFLSSLR